MIDFVHIHNHRNKKEDDAFLLLNHYVCVKEIYNDSMYDMWADV